MNKTRLHSGSSTIWAMPFISNRSLFVVLRYLLLILVSIPFIFPFWWMFTTSLKPISDVFGQLVLTRFGGGWLRDTFRINGRLQTPPG